MVKERGRWFIGGGGVSFLSSRVWPEAQSCHFRSHNQSSSIKPTLSRTPDSLIMHIGTNDLKNSSPSEISSSISSLGQEIRKEVPNTNLVISEVIIRNDDPSLNVKISELNKNLAQVCANNNWNFITHKNILPVHLNSYGLHLNKQGSSYLAKNFINFLKSD